MPPLPPPAIQTFEKHYPRAHSTIQSHADLFFKITTPCPPEKMPVGLLEDGYTRTFSGHYPPPHDEGNRYGYDGKGGHALDHTTFLTECSFIRSLPKEFQQLATLHHMFHVFFDLYDGPHALSNDKGGPFSWLENFLKVISPANKKAWEDSKVHMIGMIIVDEIVECK